MDTPQHKLMNLSPTILFLGINLFLLPLGLLTAWKMNRWLPFLGLFLGVWVAYLLRFMRPPTPFMGGGILFDIKELHELRESELRVQTFFRSREADKIVLCISYVLSAIVAIFWPTSNLFLSKPGTAVANTNNIEDLWTGSLCESLLFATITYGNYMFILFRYALKNWDRVQREYEPWPVDKSYQYSLGDLWKWFKRKRGLA